VRVCGECVRVCGRLARTHVRHDKAALITNKTPYGVLLSGLRPCDKVALS